MYPLVSELAAEGIPVVVSCRVLGLARQPYYRWLDTPIVESQLDEPYLANAVFDAHRDDPEFGYRFLADEVRQLDAHAEVSNRVVWRICRDHGWWSRFGKPKQRKGSKPGTPAMTTWCAATSPRVRRTGFGSPTSPSIGRGQGSSTSVVTWIERSYHRRRRQARLGRLTPIDYEIIIMTPQTATAA
jgi:hypothetical protein